MKHNMQSFYDRISKMLGISPVRLSAMFRAQRPDDDVAKAEAAFKQLRKLGVQIRKKGINSEDPMKWLREGRR